MSYERERCHCFPPNESVDIAIDIVLKSERHCFAFRLIIMSVADVSGLDIGASSRVVPVSGNYVRTALVTVHLGPDEEPDLGRIRSWADGAVAAGELMYAAIAVDAAPRTGTRHMHLFIERFTGLVFEEFRAWVGQTFDLPVHLQTVRYDPGGVAGAGRRNLRLYVLRKRGTDGENPVLEFGTWYDDDVRDRVARHRRLHTQS